MSVRPVSQIKDRSASSLCLAGGRGHGAEPKAGHLPCAVGRGSGGTGQEQPDVAVREPGGVCVSLG